MKWKQEFSLKTIFAVSEKGTMKRLSESRRIDIDILKGFGLFLVITNHVGFGDFLYHYSYTFHMPLFFIVSGYLYKDKGESLQSRAKRKVMGLIVPYLFYGALFIVYDIGSAIWNGNVNGVWMPVKRFLLYPTIGIPNGGPLWFLPCMFLTDLFYTAIARSVHGRQKRWAVILLIAVIGFVYSATEFMPELPWSLQPTMVSILFFQVGQEISKAETEDRGDILHFPPWKLFLVGLTWLVLSHFNVTVDMKTSNYGNAILFILGGVLGTVFWWNIAVRMIGIKKNRIIETIKRATTYLSENAITFLCMNRFFINRLNALLNIDTFESMVLYKFGIKICILFITLLGCTIVRLLLSHQKGILSLL